MLEVEGLSAWYGASHALQGVSFSVAEGEILCLLGRNGAGKTTALKTVMGLLPRRSGSVRFLARVSSSSSSMARLRRFSAPLAESFAVAPGISPSYSAMNLKQPVTRGRIASLLRSPASSR